MLHWQRDSLEGEFRRHWIFQGKETPWKAESSAIGCYTGVGTPWEGKLAVILYIYGDNSTDS